MSRGTPQREPSPGRTRFRLSRIPMLDGPDLTTRRLAVMEARSGRDGPTVWLTAGIHGDEVGGVVVVQEVFARLRKRRLRAGRVSAFPLLNPFGFETASRLIPSSREDLNRAFPGDAGGSFAQRVALVVHERIRNDGPDLVLDLHNDWIRSIPYALVDPRPSHDAGRAAHARVRQAARATGLPMVDEQEEGLSRAMLRSTLSGSLLECGIPAMTLELGAAHGVERASIEAGVDAVWSVLASLGLVEPLPEPDTGAFGEMPSGYRGRVLRYGHTPCPSTSGIVRFLVDAGDTVEMGTPLASVHDVFGRRVELLEAAESALVLGRADSSLAVPGMPLVALAMRKSSPAAAGSRAAGATVAPRAERAPPTGEEEPRA